MTVQNKSVALFFNPSIYLAGAPALGLGLAAILLAALVGSLGNIHFDGVLDTHLGASSPFWVFLLEGILDWLCLGLVLLVFGRLISRTAFRTVDVLGTQALARWPMLLMSLVMLPKAFQRFTNDLAAQLRSGGMPKINLPDALVFLAIIVSSLVCLCWTVLLMYKAFSVSCNVRGGKAIGTFVGGLLVAEILSKIGVALALQLAGTGHAVAALPTTSPAAAVSPAARPVASASDLNAAGAAFVELLAKEDFATAEIQFDPIMKTALPEATLRAAWEDLCNHAGPYQKQLRTRLKSEDGFDVVFVTCQFKKELIDVKVVYDSEKRVTGLWYLPSTAQ